MERTDPFAPGGRDLPDPADTLDEPERRLTVDDYSSQVLGAGSRTQASLGVAPAAGDDALDHAVAEPGST